MDSGSCLAGCPSLTLYPASEPARPPRTSPQVYLSSHGTFRAGLWWQPPLLAAWPPPASADTGSWGRGGGGSPPPQSKTFYLLPLEPRESGACSTPGAPEPGMGWPQNREPRKLSLPRGSRSGGGVRQTGNSSCGPLGGGKGPQGIDICPQPAESADGPAPTGAVGAEGCLKERKM